MRIRFLWLLSAVLIYIPAMGQSAADAHRKAHQAQLAKSKSTLEIKAMEEIIEEEAEISQATVSPESASLIEDLLNEARKHIGKKYVHATRGPNTFDCSGFSHYVYKQFGYDVSPAVRYQYTQGVKVDRKDARRGDLIFFTSRSSGGNVGHVGIIVDVDPETGEISFIHASLKGVKISKVEGYYANRFIGIKRIIE